jgi:alpha/beta superfamily hydrolase
VRVEPFLLLDYDFSIIHKEHYMPRKLVFISMLFIIILLSACGGYDEVANTNTSSNSEPTDIPPTATTVPPTATPTEEPTSTPTATPIPDYQTVTFSPEEGVTISGRMFGEGTTAVILAHKGYVTQDSWIDFARILADEGVTVLTFDFRGVGDSKGTFKQSQLMFDTAAAFDFLKEKGYEKIICIGASFGGTSCMAAALERDFDALVILGSRMMERAPTNIYPWELELLAMPKIFICTEDDHNDLANMAREMYDRSIEPKEIYILPGEAHTTDIFYTDQADELETILLEFVNTHK